MTNTEQDDTFNYDAGFAAGWEGKKLNFAESKEFQRGYREGRADFKEEERANRRMRKAGL